MTQFTVVFPCASDRAVRVARARVEGAWAEPDTFRWFPHQRNGSTTTVCATGCTTAVTVDPETAEVVFRFEAEHGFDHNTAVTVTAVSAAARSERVVEHARRVVEEAAAAMVAAE